MPGNRIYELIARKLSGEASEAELQELNALLDGNENDQYLYEILDKYWSQQPALKQEEMEDEEERFQRIVSGSTFVDAELPVVRRSFSRKFLYIAAAAVIAAASMLTFL